MNVSHPAGQDMSTANSWDAQETADGKAFIRRLAQT